MVCGDGVAAALVIRVTYVVGAAGIVGNQEYCHSPERLPNNHVMSRSSSCPAPDEF